MRVIAISLALLFAQVTPKVSPKPQAEAGAPKFDVASIKRNRTVEPAFTMGFLPSGQFRATGMDVRTLIAIAYQTNQRLFPSQILNGPAWIASDAWDINAKVGDELLKSMSVSLRSALIRSLLEDRFKLTLHHELREVQQYELVPAKKDGSLGPQIRRATVNCAADITSCETRALPGHLTSTSMPAGGLAAYLASNVVRTVVKDQTGLIGGYSITLEWAPESAAATDKLSIFTALQDQLGLKLQPVRAPADVVVIDHIERPAED